LCTEQSQQLYVYKRAAVTLMGRVDRYVVTGSPELERKFAELHDRQKSQSERGKWSCRRELRPVEAPPLCPCDRAKASWSGLTPN